MLIKEINLIFVQKVLPTIADHILLTHMLFKSTNVQSPYAFLFFFIGLLVKKHFRNEHGSLTHRLEFDRGQVLLVFFFWVDPHVGCLTILFWLYTSPQSSLLHERWAFLMDNSILSSPLEPEYFKLWKEGKKEICRPRVEKMGEGKLNLKMRFR